MLADRPLVSVLVAAYNAERWVLETVASALGQTYEHLEVICVDDGSTDATVDCLATLDDPRLRVIRQENGGGCAARNRAYQASTGALIQYLDADDVLHPEKIERQVIRLADEPAGTIATGPWVRFAGDVADADHTARQPDWHDYDTATDWLLDAWSGRGMIPIHAWLTPRDLTDRAGPWDEAVLRNQDGEYFTRVLVHASGLAFCPGAWSYYRTAGSGSVSRRASERTLRSLFDVTQRCERTLLSHRDTPETRAACAGLWQHYLFAAYPTLPDLVRQAERRVEALGGSPLKPSVIRPLRIVRDVVGWKAALRLQRAYLRLRTPTPQPS